jgi:ABC-type multidrug transport system fused ATPase/permease subunit
VRCAGFAREESKASVFHFRFFGGFPRQREKCLAEQEFSAGPWHAEIESKLDELRGGQSPTERSKYAAGTWMFLAWQVRRLVGRAVLLSLLGTVSVLLSVLCAQAMFSGASGARGFVLPCVGFVLFQLVLLVTSYPADKIRFQVQCGTHLELVNALNRKLLTVDPLCISELSSGALKTLASSDLKCVAEFVDSFMLQVLPFVLSVVILVPAIIYVMGVSGVVGAFVACLQIPLSMLSGKLISHMQDTAQVQRDSITTLLGEWIRNMRLVRSLSWQESFQEEIAEDVRGLVKTTVRKHLVSCVVYGMSFCWWMMPIGALVLSKYWFKVDVTLGALFASIWLLNHLSSGLQFIPYSITLFASADPCLRRVRKVLNMQDLRLKSGSWPAEGATLSRVHFKNVSVSFGDKTVLENLNFTVSGSERAAIVGPVAAGKSTLLRLLAGEVAPSAGLVEVEFTNGLRGDLWQDGLYQEYRRQIAYSPQEPFLSNTTLANNISLEAATSSEGVLEAAYAAELQADVAELEQGFQQEIGEIGVNLSGGQKQRVSLARALYSGRPFLLLDDPLSAVDTHTEKSLMGTLMSAAQRFIMVSHRVSELSKLDRIIVLEQGRIVEDASPAILMADAASRFNEFIK